MRTNSLFLIGEAWETLFNDNKVALGLEAVHYGDQAKIETTPVLCVETETQKNNLYGASRVVESEVIVSLYVYHSKIQSGQDNRRESDAYAQTISDFVHNYTQLNGLVTHCYVTDIASGQAQKQNSLVAGSKITISHHIGQIILPQSS